MLFLYFRVTGSGDNPRVLLRLVVFGVKPAEIEFEILNIFAKKNDDVTEF